MAVTKFQTPIDKDSAIMGMSNDVS